MLSSRNRTGRARLFALLAVACTTLGIPASSASAAAWFGTHEVGLPHTINAWDGPRALIPDPFGDGYWVRDGYTSVARLAHVGATGETDRIVPTPPSIQSANIIADSDGTFLASDPTSTTITRFDEHGAILQQFGTAGTAPGQLQRPMAMALARDGSYYVADSTNDTVIQFERDGTVRGTFGSFGTGDGQFRDVYGIAVAPNDDVYTVDATNRRVTRFDSAGVFISRWGSLGAGTGQFSGPRAITIDQSSSDVFVADTGNRRIQRFTAAGVFVNVVADSLSARHVVRPLAVFASYGEVRVLDTGTNQVNAYSAAGVPTVVEGDALDAGGAFRYVRDIAVAPDGSYIASDYFAHRLQRFSASGQFLNLIGSYGLGTPGLLETPRGVALTANGDVLVADSTNSRVQRFRPDGTFVSTFGTNGTGPGQFATPSNIAVLPNGELLVTDSGGSTIQRFQDDGTYLATIATLGSGPGQVSGPRGIAIGADGTIYICDATNHRIAKFAADGTFISNFGTYGSAPGEFDTPYSIDLLPSGNLVIADTMNNRLQIFTPAGTLVDVISGTTDGSVVPTFSHPNTVAVAPDGSLLASDRVGHRIVRITYDDLAPSPIATMVPAAGGVRLTATASADSGFGVDPDSSISLDGGATWTGSIDTVINGAPWSLVERTLVARDRAGNVSAPVTVSGRVADVVPPTLTLTRTPRGNTPITVRSSITFASGDDASGISNITATFRGKSVRVDGSTVSFAKVPEGRGELVLRATDEAGNEVVVRSVVIVDRTAPKLRPFASHIFGGRATFAWSDSVSGVRSATRFETKLRYGPNRIRLTATDRTGNTVTMHRTVYRHPSLARPELNRGAPGAFTERGQVNGALRFIGQTAPWYASTDDSPEVVGEVQVRLRLFGFLRGYARVGSLDLKTIRAIQAYQSARGLPVLGTVGPRTRAMLDRDLVRSVTR